MAGPLLTVPKEVVGGCVGSLSLTGDAFGESVLSLNRNGASYLGGLPT